MFIKYEMLNPPCPPPPPHTHSQKLRENPIRFQLDFQFYTTCPSQTLRKSN